MVEYQLLVDLFRTAWMRRTIRQLLQSSKGQREILDDELVELVRTLIHARPQIAVEIGCFCGVTSRILAWHLRRKFPHSTLYCIDTFETEQSQPGYYDDKFTEQNMGFNYEKKFDANIREFGERVVKLKGPSDAVPLPEKFTPDFIFIDGDHSYEGVKKDIERYAPLLALGGYLCFHDVTIGRSGTLRALLDTLWPTPNAQYYRLISHVRSLLVIQKISQTPPCGYAQQEPPLSSIKRI